MRRRTYRAMHVLFALTFALGSMASANVARAQEPARSSADRATELYARGRDAFVAGKPADAYLLLQASSALDPSPNTDLLMGHSLVQLGRVVDAILAYESATLRSQDAPRYAETAAEAANRRAELLPRVGRIELAGPEGMKATLTRPNMAPVDFDGPATVYSEAGTVTARWTVGDQPTERTVTVEAGSVVKLFIEQTPGTETVIDRTVSPWVPTGVVIASTGGVTLAIAAALGVVTQGLYDDLEACTAEPCGDRSAAELRSEGESFQTATNVCLVAGGTLAVAGVVMLVIALVTDDDAAPVKPTAGGLALAF